MRLKISLGWTMLWKGHVARFERRQGEMLEWRVDATREHIQFTDEMLADGIAKGDLKLSRPADVQKIDAGGKVVRNRMRNVSDKALAEADRKLRYVMAASAEGGLIGASQLDKKHFLHLMRRSAPLDEMKMRDISVRTLERWLLQDGGECDRTRLIPRHHDKGRREDQLHEDVRQIVELRIDELWMRRPRATFLTLMAFIKGDIDAWNAERPSSMRLPEAGKAAVRLAIKRRRQSDLAAMEFGQAIADTRFVGRRTLADPDRPLDRLEMDATKIDVIVVDEETLLPIGRPTLVIAVDRCTRMPAGFVLTFDPPSIHTIMECLRNAVFPKTYLTEMREKHGWTVKNDWPVYGKPRTIALDQGMDNLSDSVTDVCMDLGINEVAIMGRKRPWQKGAIERIIGTVSRGLFHAIPGTTYSNVMQRVGYDPMKDAIATLEEVEHAIHKYLIDEYARKGHGGLTTGIHGRPIDKWNALADEDEVDFIPDIAEAHQLFGRSFEATIRPSGVPYKRLLFYSNELTRLLDDNEFLRLSPRRRVQCRLATGDIRRIFVELPHTGELLEVPIAEKWAEYATGLSIWQHERILDFRNAAIKAGEEEDDLPQMRRELSERIVEGRGRRKKTKHQVNAVRWEGHGRQARAGRNASTVVPGSGADRKPRKPAVDLRALVERTPEQAPPTLPAPAQPIADPYAGMKKNNVI